MSIFVWESDLDSVSKEALKVIIKERDRLAHMDEVQKPHLKAAMPLLLPKRNLRQKLQTALISPHRWQLILGLFKTLFARVSLLKVIVVFFNFPREIIKLQSKVEALEFQIVEQQVRLLEISKSSQKNS